MDPETTTALVLLIDSDESHSATLTAVLRRAGYAVESTAHGVALQLLHRRHAFDAVILCAAAEPSTLSPQDRLGEFVLRYMTHVVPALVPRTIVLSTIPRDAEGFAATHAVLGEPFDEEALLQSLAVCVRR